MISVGYIKLHRKLLEWEWYNDISTKTVFIHLLLTAQLKKTSFQGYEIPKGSRVCSYQKLAEETGLSVQNVRTAINHLKSTGELTISKTPKFSIISIKNWSKYQEGNKVSNNQPTSNQQHNKNKRKKEECLNTPKRVFKHGEEEQAVSQYADRNDAWD